MKMTLSVGSTGKNKTYTKSEDFSRYSSVKKGMSSVLTEVVASEVYQKMNLKPHQRISKGELRDAVKVQRGEIRKNLNRGDYIRKSSFSDKNLGIQGKYELAAQTFYRIVCRTPYDEDYDYTVSVTSKEYKPNKRFSSTEKSWRYVNHTFVRKHIADEDRVKDFWQMRFKTSEGYFAFSMKDFEGIEFENISDENWVQVENIIGKKAGWGDFSDLEIFNLHPRTDMLEYGRYTKESVIGSYEKHTGPNRDHGVYGGYSVQAPRGFIGLSIEEFRNSSAVNKYNYREFLTSEIRSKNPQGHDDGYAWMYFTRHKERIYSDKLKWVVGYSVNLSRYLKHAVVQDLKKSDWVEEKDLLKAFLNGKKDVKINARNIASIKEKSLKIANAELKKGIDLIGGRNFNFYDTLKKRNKESDAAGNLKLKLKTLKTEEVETTDIKTSQNGDRQKIIDEIAKGRTRVYGIVTMPNDLGEDTDYYCKVEKGKFYKTIIDVDHIEQEDLPRSTFEEVNIGSLMDSLFNSMFTGDNPFIEVQL